MTAILLFFTRSQSWLLIYLATSKKTIQAGFHGFLLAVDIFSSFVYTFVLKKKDSVNIKKALENLIKESGAGFEVITGDVEFNSLVNQVKVSVKNSEKEKNYPTKNCHKNNPESA